MESAIFHVDGQLVAALPAPNSPAHSHASSNISSLAAGGDNSTIGGSSIVSDVRRKKSKTRLEVLSFPFRI